MSVKPPSVAVTLDWPPLPCSTSVLLKKTAVLVLFVTPWIVVPSGGLLLNRTFSAGFGPLPVSVMTTVACALNEPAIKTTALAANDLTTEEMERMSKLQHRKFGTIYANI